MKKTTALLTALAMMSSMAMFASAEGASYAIGDVDMDGVVTGHDTAMVSRYLVDDEYDLTEEQLELADVDGDGEVTQADADALHEMEVYMLGQLSATIDGEEETSFVQIRDAQFVISYYKSVASGTDWAFGEVSEVQLNIADTDLDGEITITDALNILKLYCRKYAFLSVFATDDVYFCSSDPSSPAYFSEREMLPEIQ